MKKYTFLTFILISSLFSACESDSGDLSVAPGESISPTGVAGSYARFLTIGDFLYIVDDQKLKTYSTEEAARPSLVNEQTLGEGIESIFHTRGKLFIGSSSGLYIYTIQASGIPTETAFYSYDYPILPCDPVVANDSLAFVTLNANQADNSPCGGIIIEVNVLKVFDVTNLDNPVLIAEYPMTNPKGVGIDGNTLFVCDGEAGLKVYDFSKPTDLQQIFTYPGIDTYDVIPLNGLLILVGPNNLYQFDYSDLNDIKLISTIAIGT
jgi:hypothetical protein